MTKVVFQSNNFLRTWSPNTYGLLIGISSADFIHVFVALECPEDGDLDSSKKDIIEAVNPKWICSHSLNVFRMLPGGVEIVGFYYVDSKKSTNLIKIEKILNEINLKEVSTFHELFSSSKSPKIYAKFDSQKNVVQEISFDKEKNNQFSNIEIHYDNILNQYQKIQSNICIKIDAIMPNERDKDKILRQLKNAVNPFVSEFLTSSTMLINGIEIEHSDSKLFQYSKFSEANDVKTGDGDNNDQTNPETKSSIEIVFVGVEMQPGLESESENETSVNMINRLKIYGRIPGFAFLHSDATVKQAENALKRDLTKSLFTRLELLTEELHITGGQIEVSQMLLPQRVLLNLPNTPGMPLSDYKFLSETPSDVITRVRYFCRPAGIPEDEIDIRCIDTSGLEKSEQTSIDDELSEVETVEFEKELATSSMSQTRGIFLFVCLSGLVFLLSLVAYYILN